GFRAATCTMLLALACPCLQAADGAAAPSQPEASARLHGIPMRADVAALPNAPEPQPPSLPGAPLTSPFRNITLPEPTPGGPLSLDDAIHRAVLGNLQIQLATQQDRAVRGQILTAIYALLPNMKATFATTANEINLAALGFKPRSLAAFGLPPNAIHTIVKVDTTSAQF